MSSRYLKNVLLAFMRVLSVINKLLPKYNFIIFFTNNSESNDNNRALLKQFVDLGIDSRYRIYFFSKDGKKYNHFKSVVYKNTYLAPLYFLFARYCFYDCGTVKIKPSNAQVVISLWHGVPLKRIGLMADERSSFMDTYDDFTKILVPHPFWNDVYKNSFGCEDDQILINGFPRNDFLFKPNFDSLSRFGIPNDGRRKVLWMPTFRRSISQRYVDSDLGDSGWDLPLFPKYQDIKLFDSLLEGRNLCLVIKLHPYSVLNLQKFDEFNNICFVKNSDLNGSGILNYEFVSCFDALITDYSSIIFDYLLLNRPMAFTVDDMKSYASGRGFSIPDPESYLVGEKIFNSADLLQFLENGFSADSYVSQREQLIKRVHQCADGNSTLRLVNFLGL